MLIQAIKLQEAYLSARINELILKGLESERQKIIALAYQKYNSVNKVKLIEKTNFLY
mgnify:CR=1 FL=1